MEMQLPQVVTAFPFLMEGYNAITMQEGSARWRVHLWGTFFVLVLATTFLSLLLGITIQRWTGNDAIAFLTGFLIVPLAAATTTAGSILHQAHNQRRGTLFWAISYSAALFFTTVLLIVMLTAGKVS